MTAFGDIDTAIRSLQLDASDFITKPINDQALSLALQRAKDRYSSSQQIKDYTSLLETGWSSATRALLKNFSFQKQIIDASINGIIACGAKGTIKIMNDSAAAMLGYDKTDIMDKMAIEELFSRDEFERINRIMDSDTHGGQHRIDLLETRLQDSGGTDIPVQISASVLFEEKEKNGILICVRDLRELRKIERKMADQEQVLHQDKMMSLGKLAASVVHEINNPLSGILNYLKLMSKMMKKELTPERTEKFGRYLEISITEISRCSRIVSNLLTFSRKSAMTFEPVDVKELVNRCVLLSQHKLELQNVTLTSKTDENMPKIQADAGQIQQCIINLIFNALDAMPDGGSVTLHAAHDTKKDQVLVHVKDTGTGIDPKDLPYIFEPFFTTKDEGYGVGLGLSTVFGIMERHGGTIRVEETSPGGTHFVLVFNRLVKS